MSSNEAGNERCREREAEQAKSASPDLREADLAKSAPRDLREVEQAKSTPPDLRKVDRGMNASLDPRDAELASGGRPETMPSDGRPQERTVASRLPGPPAARCHGAGRTEVKLTLFAAGYCTHRESLTIRGGGRRTIRFPAAFACLEHPDLGPVLFDTGYSRRFFEQTERFPGRLYRWTTPVYFREEDSAARQLKEAGIDPNDVRTIILSHFHADHIGGVMDFPQAEFVYLNEAYVSLRSRRSALSMVKAGFLPGLLPADFDRRSRPIDEAKQRIELPDCLRPFEQGYDLFGDGSVIAIDLSGHAPGQIGIYFVSAGQEYLLCADAAWSSRAYRDNAPPHPMAGLIKSDWRLYLHNLQQLHELHAKSPHIRIVPAHCGEWWESAHE